MSTYCIVRIMVEYEYMCESASSSLYKNIVRVGHCALTALIVLLKCHTVRVYKVLQQFECERELRYTRTSICTYGVDEDEEDEQQCRVEQVGRAEQQRAQKAARGAHELRGAQQTHEAHGAQHSRDGVHHLVVERRELEREACEHMRISMCSSSNSPISVCVACRAARAARRARRAGSSRSAQSGAARRRRGARATRREAR